LLNILREYYSNTKEVPISTKIKNPSSEVYYTRFKTNSWNKILELACVPIKYVNEYDKTESLNKLREYYNILGKIPTKEDFNKYNWKPNYSYYYKNFDTYENACYLAKLIDKPLTDEERIGISIKNLIDLYNEIGRCPKVSEYESIKHKGFQRRVLEDKLNMKYNDICRKYLSCKVNSDKDITKEDIIQSITKMYKELGRPPMFIEVKTQCKYSMNLFKSKFNMTFNDVIKSLGWIPYGSDVTYRSKEDLLNDFLALFNKLNRIPYYNDIDNCREIASTPTYIKYFGTIENVCKLLDIDYELFYKNAGAGKICFDSNNNLCKSLIEKDISNYFIFNNINFEKETKYNSYIDNCKKRFDWKIDVNDKFYLIEYFGMYDGKNRGSLGRRYSKNVKKKIKLLYKNNLIDKCILIFPWDIKHKTLDEIFNPYIND